MEQEFSKESLTWDKFSGPVDGGFDAIVRNAAQIANRMQAFDSAEYLRMDRIEKAGGYDSQSNEVSRLEVMRATLKEMDEPHESGQVGSSAMAYKTNPMRAERMASLARYGICEVQNAAVTAASQWLERSLDDSANRRLAIPEAFLAADAILNLYIGIARGLQVHPAVCEKHLREELPFLATENILMYCVEHKGADRQETHERIRRHAMAAAEQVKRCGKENDLIERIRTDSAFGLDEEELTALLDPASFTGMAQLQCERFLRDEVRPLLLKNADSLGADVRINV